MSDRADAIAREIMRQHEAGERYRDLPAPLGPRDMEEAYAAQFRLHELHEAGGRGPLGGRKIALASAVQQRLCGVDHPIAGGIFAAEIVESPATIRLADHHGLGLEFELAVTLGEDVAPDDGPLDAAGARAKAAAIRPAFELIIDRGADYGDLDARTMAADNAWCAGVVLGPEIEGWRDMDVEGTPVALLWNDEPAVAAKVGDADPFGSLAWVANVLTSAGRTIRAGEVVITGSVIKTRAPK
ncbi:MAG: hypothetical protein AAGF90_07485, partial [Pseudomonadota bacterium]